MCPDASDPSDGGGVMRIRTLLVDDETLARRRLRELLEDIPDVDIIGERATGREAKEFVREHECDLLLLDIQMPRLSGVALTRALGEAPLPLVVFVTAHDSFAVEAFDTRAVDYLLKPVRAERLARALDRVRAQLQVIREVGASTLGEERPVPVAKPIQRLIAKTGNRAVILETNRVDWIESAGNYVIVQSGEERHIIRETMANLESGLPAQRFIRVNRSLIVRIDQILELTSDGSGDFSVVLKDGRRASITMGYRELERRLKYES